MPPYPLLETGQQAATTSAAALPSVTLGAGAGIRVTLTALAANANPIYYGPQGVTDSTGAELAPGASVELRVDDLEMIYIVSSAGGNIVSWAVTPI